MVMSPILRVVSLAALIFGGMGTLHAADPFSGFEDCPVVTDSDLDQMRGGFETSTGGLPLSVTFGIEHATYLNGQLVSTMTLIQNNQDNQVIGNVAIINASITSRDFLRSLAVQTSLNQMNFRSVH